MTQLETIFNKANAPIVMNEYMGYTLYTKEVSLDHYITFGLHINGNKVLCESKPNQRKTSVEKAQALISKTI